MAKKTKKKPEKPASVLSWLGAGKPDALGFTAIDPIKWQALVSVMRKQ